MDNLISRQAAIDAIERNAYRHTYIDQIVDIIKGLPSAQPEKQCESWERERRMLSLPTIEERKTGRWIDKKCSRCGCGSMLGLCIENFCPNCGADMRGEDDG